MPTIDRWRGYRFYFYSHEPNEPPHSHVDARGCSAKFWLQPVALARSIGFSAKELAELLAQARGGRQPFWRHGMGILAPGADERVRDVRIDADTLSVALMDGRTISVPLAWFPRLLDATPAQRARWEPAGAGYGIHWPDLDEDLSTEGLLRGAPAARVRQAD